MKRVEDSRTENTYLIMNKHINSYGRLFGGVLMQWIDEMAGIVAHRHAGTIVTTACVDNLNFKAGAYLGNTVVLIGKMTYVGRTSMEVRIDTYVEDSDGMRKMINRAYEVMVALDENDNKVEVPGLIVETESEKAEWQDTINGTNLEISQMKKQGWAKVLLDKVKASAANQAAQMIESLTSNTI